MYSVWQNFIIAWQNVIIVWQNIIEIDCLAKNYNSPDYNFLPDNYNILPDNYRILPDNYKILPDNYKMVSVECNVENKKIFQNLGRSLRKKFEIFRRDIILIYRLISKFTKILLTLKLSI